MRMLVAGLPVLAAVALVSIVGAVAFLAASKLANLYPSAKGSHLTEFIVTIIGIAVAVGSAFPIFGRGLPWLTELLKRAWPAHGPERSISPELVHIEHQQIGGAVERDLASDPAAESAPLANPHRLDSQRLR